MTSIDEFAAGFSEDPGYLDFATIGPLGRTVIEEQRAGLELLRRARFGSLSGLDSQDDRMRHAASALLGFRADQVTFQPNTSTGLMHVMFGLTGGVALSAAEFPSVTFAAVRAAESLGVLAPTWLDTAGGPVTPGAIRDQLTSSIVALAVSLVDFRTGYLADLDGIRQVIGDRLLIVDAIQGFGVVDVPWEVVDVVVCGGQKWLRAGKGTGFLALSDRAVERLTPVFSGFAASESDEAFDGVLPPRTDAGAYSVSPPDPLAEARLAVALEGIAEVGIPAIHERLAEKVSRVIELADEVALPIVSSRAVHERAGIVVLAPGADRLTPLIASLHNHGVSATVRGSTVRLSPHVSTTEETFGMLRAALLGYASTVTV